MNRFPLLLAFRYLFGAQQKKSISTMIIISCLGIFIGSFSLMLTLAIMHGFDVVTCERLQSIHSQVIIRAFGDPINMDALEPVLQKEFPEIASFSPTVMQQVIIQNPHTDDISTVVAIKGINPQTGWSVSNLAQKIYPNMNQSNLTTIIDNRKIIIGKKLAESLDVSIGDTVTLLFAPEETKKKRINLNEQKVTIGGYFSTGIEDFDIGLIFGSLDLVHQLFPESGITHVQVKLHKGVDETTIIQKLRSRLHMEVYSWRDLYPALVSALKLEKYVMFVILMLISLIASMNIISLIFMQINQKRADIAILRAYGMTAHNIRMIFIYMGGAISFISSMIGIICAIFCSLFLKQYPFITLPDAYFVTHLPVHLELVHIIIVFCCCMILSFVGIWIPLRRTEEINITEVLRYNG
jgi:lipoprotein-releasing system permease protein